MTAQAIAETAFNGTQGFGAERPADRLRFMLEFLNCNGVGSESDDLQAEVIRECRKLTERGSR